MATRPERKRKPHNLRSLRSANLRNALSLTGITFIVSLLIAGPVDSAIGRVHIAFALFVLIGVIVTSVVADMIGVAAASADETPFHAMATDRVLGAKESVSIVRQSARVNSICCDVVGDVCGTISGALGVELALHLKNMLPHAPMAVVSVLTLSTIASVTVGAKALTKGVAVRNAKNIVATAGRVVAVTKKINAQVKRFRQGLST